MSTALPLKPSTYPYDDKIGEGGFGPVYKVILFLLQVNFDSFGL